MTDITIPPEALEKAAREQARRDNVQWDALNERAKALRLDDARAACLAMLEAWPGVWKHPHTKSIILPLTENPNDQG